MNQHLLEKVVLAISAFRSDESVIALIERAHDAGKPLFGALIVVDSLGSGRIAEAISSQGWIVDYVNADRNLGSAGNLDMRLKRAGKTNLDWCLALNHDAQLDPAKASSLVACGESDHRVGAVYPWLKMMKADGRLDRPRQSFTTLGLFETSRDLTGPIEVSWSSSNGALYRLNSIRDGVSAWPQLWMGYEDLAIGWEFQRRNWKQWVCRDVVVEDTYEFRPLRFFGRTIHIADKPVWYSYYQLRNLALIARGSKGKALSWPAFARRALIDFVMLAVRPNRLRRVSLLIRGLVDGLRGVDGIGPVSK